MKKSLFGANLVENFEDFEIISKKYDIYKNELVQMDLNRCGIYLNSETIKVGFRVRFKAKILNETESWYALPVRSKNDTLYELINNEIYFLNNKIGEAFDIQLDTCDTSYKRGPYLLNLNSRRRSACGGCKACIHNYHKLYDATVIKDRVSLNGEKDIKEYFEKMNFDIKNYDQIAVVTGLFPNENAVVEHMKDVYNVAKNMGFHGELMYFGCQVNSDEALKELSKIENFYLIYAVDNFSKRDNLLTKLKSNISLEYAKDTLKRAQNHGIKTSLSYIAGIESLVEVEKGFKYFKDVLSSFPIINIYQIQTTEQAAQLDNTAENLEYYINARKIIENIFIDTNLRPKRWENYRPLWYSSFKKEKLLNDSYGILEHKGEM